MVAKIAFRISCSFFHCTHDSLQVQNENVCIKVTTLDKLQYTPSQQQPNVVVKKVAYLVPHPNSSKLFTQFTVCQNAHVQVKPKVIK